MKTRKMVAGHESHLVTLLGTGAGSETYLHINGTNMILILIATTCVMSSLVTFLVIMGKLRAVRTSWLFTHVDNFDLPLHSIQILADKKKK